MQSKAWITLLQWKSWKNPLQLMPSDPAASVCLNMWSAGRGTLNGEDPRAAQPLEIVLQGWVDLHGDACMTSVRNKKLALVLGKCHGPPVASQRQLLGGHIASYVVTGHFALISDALATKMSILKVKMLNGGTQTNKQHQRKPKEKGCILCKWVLGKTH